MAEHGTKDVAPLASLGKPRPEQGQDSFRSGFVAIIGRPNVGKSTLLNQLLQFKLSIVSPKAQTTRHKVRGILSTENYQAIFLDTPGAMQHARDLLDERMLARIHEAMKEADLIVLMVEPHLPGDIEQRLIERLRQMSKPAILAINKIDLVKKADLLPIIDVYRQSHNFAEIVPISALKGDGLGLLQDLIVRYLPEGEPLYPPDQLTDRPERFLVTEIIREKVYHLYGEEIPYHTAVEIEEFQEARPKEGRNKDFIRAVIYVNKDSQKKILIGRGGQALRQVGILAREEIEALLGRPVYLELWVKTRPKWRENSAFLRQVGY